MRDSSFWREYLSRRTGTYEYRTRRYAAVADELERLGLRDGDLVVDVGAGMCEFGRYLYQARGWSGQYVPIDGSIDGVDLNVWVPFPADFYVAIEILEHLDAPDDMLLLMRRRCRKGIVVTTPNTDVLGGGAVLAMDPTHVTAIYAGELRAWSLSVSTASLFTDKQDTLIGVFDIRGVPLANDRPTCYENSQDET